MTMATLPESKHAAGGQKAGGRKILQMHRYRKQYRGHSATIDKDFVIEFLFSVRPESGGAFEYFWCEVQLKADLAGHGAWKELSRDDRIKAMYCFAVDAIRDAAGRVVRQTSMNWHPLKPYAEKPCWDLAKVNLRDPEPVVIEGEGIHPEVSDVR